MSGTGGAINTCVSSMWSWMTPQSIYLHNVQAITFILIIFAPIKWARFDGEKN